MVPYYEKLDFDEDPFTTNPKKHSDKLVGMDDVLEEAFYRINSGNMLVLQGKEGTGKTSILWNVIKRLGGRGQIIYFDCSDADKDLNITKLLEGRMGLAGILLGKKPKNMILLLDNIESLSKINNERIKYYFDHSFIRSVIFTCDSYSKVKFSDSLKDRIGKRVISTRQITDEEAVKMIRNRIGSSEILTDELILDIFKKSERNPRLLLENCGKIAENIAKNGRDRIKYIDVTRALGDSK